MKTPELPLTSLSALTPDTTVSIVKPLSPTTHEQALPLPPTSAKQNPNTRLLSQREVNRLVGRALTREARKQEKELAPLTQVNRAIAARQIN